MRPSNFTINKNHTLARGLVFAGLGAGANPTPDGTENVRRVYDSSLNKYHMSVDTIYSDRWPTWTHHLGRNGLFFDDNDLLWCHVDLPQPISGVSHTYSCWAKSDTAASDEHTPIFLGDPPPSATNYTNLSLRSGSQTWHLRRSTGGGTTSDVGAIVATATYPRDEWHHYTCRGISAGVWELWVDGQLGATYDGATSPGVVAQRIALGAMADQTMDGWFGGWMLDPMVWDRILSPAEIRLIANPADPMLGGFIHEGLVPNLYDLEGVR